MAFLHITKKPSRASSLLQALVLPCLLLAGCVSVPKVAPSSDVLACHPRSPDDGCPSFVTAAASKAVEQLAAEGDWQFQGRAALSGGGQGGSARIEWEHQASRLDVVVLSAPVTRQSWRLELAADGSATLHGMPGGPRQGSDAQALLREASGWEIPAQPMRYWVRGHADPQLAVDEFRFGRSTGMDLAGFNQAGWRIDIAERDAQGRPTRLNAEQPQAGHRVRLVIDQWDAPGP